MKKIILGILGIIAASGILYHFYLKEDLELIEEREIHLDCAGKQTVHSIDQNANIVCKLGNEEYMFIIIKIRKHYIVLESDKHGLTSTYSKDSEKKFKIKNEDTLILTSQSASNNKEVKISLVKMED